MREIKDYLYLYLGCDVYVFPDDTLTNGWLEKQLRTQPTLSYKYQLNISNYNIVLDAGYKPILRHLDEITESEAVELYNEMFPGVDKDDNQKHFLIHAQLTNKGVYYEGTVSMLDYVHWFPWLLRRGFDLFGLIDSGLAIKSIKP